MSEIPLSVLMGILALLIVFSAFFSSSETALMTLNRLKLKNLAKTSKGAKLAQKLLNQPDRLIGLILIGNNFINIAASTIATIAAFKIANDSSLTPEAAAAYGTIILTLLILIFAEVTPKTYAALHPERIAFPASFILTPLLKILYPIVWTTNLMTNGILRIIGVPKDVAEQALSREELRTLVIENHSIRPDAKQKMVINLLDLEHITVDDTMVPRSEVVGIDITDNWDDIIKQLVNTYLTRLPIYEEDINNVIGILHIRTILPRLSQGKLDLEGLLSVLRKPYFVPEGANLTTQIKEFQKRERRMGLVVDEYGDIQGLVTIDDILEEIVGDFTSEPKNRGRHIIKKGENEYLVDGRIQIRSLNRRLQWDLPLEDASTLSGLITEHLGNLPNNNTAIKLDGYQLTILNVDEDNVINKVLVKKIVSFD
ncbi:MAG TPA: CNNM domain-containing protein [Gammaproteobacteria bacterium]|nr:CNNM domain-containing protein [Gammaproteobacteria bacterium]